MRPSAGLLLFFSSEARIAITTTGRERSTSLPCHQQNGSFLQVQRPLAFLHKYFFVYMQTAPSKAEFQELPVTRSMVLAGSLPSTYGTHWKHDKSTVGQLPTLWVPSRSPQAFFATCSSHTTHSAVIFRAFIYIWNYFP